MNEIWFLLYSANFRYEGRTTEEAKAIRFFQQGQGRIVVAYTDTQSWDLRSENDWRHFHGLTR